jgi:Coenzyme PQQ synthesis protein D (PqqD)
VAAPGEDLLGIAPVRVARWEEKDARVVLHRPAPGWCGWRTPFEWIAHALASPRLRLDEIGSFAWKRLDGRATVGEVAAAVRERFGAAAEPTDERLGQLVRGLLRERLVGLPRDERRP